MKKQAFFKWIWNKGQLSLEGQLWPKGSLRLGLHFEVSTIYQLALVQGLGKLLIKRVTFCSINPGKLAVHLNQCEFIGG